MTAVRKIIGMKPIKSATQKPRDIRVEVEYKKRGLNFQIDQVKIGDDSSRSYNEFCGLTKSGHIALYNFHRNVTDIFNIETG